MGGRQDQSFSVQVVFNYWEGSPQSLSERLDRLEKQGCRDLVSFVPWQSVEGDINHSLSRYIQCAGEKKLRISLVLTPEVGIHYPYSGLPKALATDESVAAKDRFGNPMSVFLGPSGFMIPSFFHTDFVQRYQQFLTRMDHFLCAFSQKESTAADHVTLLVSGSYWKYYRSAAESSLDPFGAIAGDFSGNSLPNYRKAVDDFYSDAEFSDPSPNSASWWRTQAMDGINRAWFLQHSEDFFRYRTARLLQKKGHSIRLKHVELFTPEADPSVFYSQLFSSLSGGVGDFDGLSNVLSRANQLVTTFDGMSCPNYVHFTGLGCFSKLNDTQKQFLIMKALTQTASRKGAVLVDEDQWFRLSPGFRLRTESLAHNMLDRKVSVNVQAVYYSPHTWSGEGNYWKLLSEKYGALIQKGSSLSILGQYSEAKLVFVDPDMILTEKRIQDLLSLSSSGQVIVIPKSSLYTKRAKLVLAKALSGLKKAEVDLGIPYCLYPSSGGHVVVYDAMTSPSKVDADRAARFVRSVGALAELCSPCVSNHKKVEQTGLRKDSGYVSFVFNPNDEPTVVDLEFDGWAKVAGFPSANNLSDDVPPLKELSLEIPPFGVLPLEYQFETVDLARSQDEISEKRL